MHTEFDVRKEFNLYQGFGFFPPLTNNSECTVPDSLCNLPESYGFFITITAVNVGQDTFTAFSKRHRQDLYIVESVC